MQLHHKSWALSLIVKSSVLAIPSRFDASLFTRAIGDGCSAPEGSGSCQSTSDCLGISYTEALCPSDPDDVQCCVTIGCNSSLGVGYCRSVSNDGCSGGSFDPSDLCPGSQDIQCCVPDGSTGGDDGGDDGSSSDTGSGTACTSQGQDGICRSVSNEGCSDGYFDPANLCPGSQDIQCCVLVASSPSSSSSVPAPTYTPDPCTAEAADELEFSVSIDDFESARNAESPSCFDWSSDNCSDSPDNPAGFAFEPYCQRHDFGYRNSKKEGRCDEDYRNRVDDQLKAGLYDYCSQFSGFWESWRGVECRRIADTYYAAVRNFGSC